MKRRENTREENLVSQRRMRGEEQRDCEKGSGNIMSTYFFILCGREEAEELGRDESEVGLEVSEGKEGREG